MSQVEGRQCGSCSACCTLLRINALDKPARTKCVHLSLARGPLVRKLCTAYATRPEECQNFLCLWMTTPEIPRNWRPDKLRLMFTGYVLGEPVGQVVVITALDPGAYRMRADQLDTIMLQTNWPTSALIMYENTSGQRYLVGGPQETVARYRKWGDGTTDSDPRYLRWTHRPVNTG